MRIYYRYLRALAAFYLRLVGSSVEVYTHLEPLLADYRKLRRRTESKPIVFYYN
jgi:pre-mRNA-splicing factor 38A